MEFIQKKFWPETSKTVELFSGKEIGIGWRVGHMSEYKFYLLSFHLKKKFQRMVSKPLTIKTTVIRDGIVGKKVWEASIRKVWKLNQKGLASSWKRPENRSKKFYRQNKISQQVKRFEKHNW